MELEKLKSRWDNFHVSCVVFYAVYGFLCVFAYRPYSRYIYFYLTYLIENNQIREAKIITDELDYIKSV